MAKKPRKSGKLINKKARHEYIFLETFEAGIVLTGDEIKAVKSNKVNLTGSHVKILNGEAFWIGGLINIISGDQQRTKKLLLNKVEIERIAGKSEERGLTIIPTKIYLKCGKAKLEIALARGKKLYDKRALLKSRDLDREAMRKIKFK